MTLLEMKGPESAGDNGQLTEILRRIGELEESRTTSTATKLQAKLCRPYAARPIRPIAKCRSLCDELHKTQIMLQQWMGSQTSEDGKNFMGLKGAANGDIHRGSVLVAKRSRDKPMWPATADWTASASVPWLQVEAELKLL